MSRQRNFNLLLVRQILSHPFDYDWSWQGFGMFRLYLSKQTRLHVWSPKHATKKVSTIHNHPWNFESEVLQGSILDRGYRDSGLWNPEASPATHMRQKIVCGPGGCAVAPPEPARLTPGIARRIHAGDSYHMHASEIHESEPTPGCVTIISREFLTDTEHAVVYYPIGTEWVSAEPRPATKDEIASMAEIALSVPL